jgi:hypothetical protein
MRTTFIRKKIIFLLSLLLLVAVAVAAHQHHEEEEEEEGPSSNTQQHNNLFLLNYTNFNHGSFGSCPQQVLEYQTSLRKQQEQQPDPFLRDTYKKLWNDTRVEVASSLRTDYKQLVLIESASTGINSILRSLDYHEEVKIVVLMSLFLSVCVCVCVCVTPLSYEVSTPLIPFVLHY